MVFFEECQLAGEIHRPGVIAWIHLEPRFAVASRNILIRKVTVAPTRLSSCEIRPKLAIGDAPEFLGNAG